MVVNGVWKEFSLECMELFVVCLFVLKNINIFLFWNILLKEKGKKVGGKVEKMV